VAPGWPAGRDGLQNGDMWRKSDHSSVGRAEDCSWCKDPLVTGSNPVGRILCSFCYFGEPVTVALFGNLIGGKGRARLM
jgi:hypothetical protein